MLVVVLGGGDSPEREVSLRSAKAVADAARAAGFEGVELDPRDGLAALDKLPKSTVVLPILHGAGGEDGTLQAELQKRGLPYMGADSRSSKACFDKWQTRQALTKAGLPMPEGVFVTAETYAAQPLAKRPHVLKVNRGGSSIGTLIVRDPAKVDARQVQAVFELDKQAILEELIEGTEITVPVLDQTALTPIEIRPPEGGEFDYENKYSGVTAELCPPESVSEAVQKQAMKLAERVHKVMGCRHLSRTDLMIDSGGHSFILEINTIPGLTAQSLFPKSAAVAGLDMPKLVARFIAMVKRDYHL